MLSLYMHAIFCSHCL